MMHPEYLPKGEISKSDFVDLLETNFRFPHFPDDPRRHAHTVFKGIIEAEVNTTRRFDTRLEETEGRGQDPKLEYTPQVYDFFKGIREWFRDHEMWDSFALQSTEVLGYFTHPEEWLAKKDLENGYFIIMKFDLLPRHRQPWGGEEIAVVMWRSKSWKEHIFKGLGSLFGGGRTGNVESDEWYALIRYYQIGENCDDVVEITLFDDMSMLKEDVVEIIDPRTYEGDMWPPKKWFGGDTPPKLTGDKLIPATLNWFHVPRVLFK